MDRAQLSTDGYQILPGVIARGRCSELAAELVERMVKSAIGKIPAENAKLTDVTNNKLVGGRNLQQSWDGWREITAIDSVARFIRRHVGADAGLVRILYFDKPPGHGWALSQHRDRTIAVAQHHDPAAPFSRPTRKAGVPHVRATDQVLASMLTLRLHLDPMRSENGPLTVVPGSHRMCETVSPLSDQPGRTESSQPESVQVIHCKAGDLFAMRPLLLHGSLASQADTAMHRRVIHLEIAPSEQLPPPYRWYQFDRLSR